MGQEQSRLVKPKWEINLEQMVLVGKYFKTNKEYVNVMKVNKKYRRLVEQYKEYPLVDYWLTMGKWEITIDVMMIIGKYFKKSIDYVNVMKVCKVYHDLVSMYHFNPISECELFENMESQYLYRIEDQKNKKEGMHKYVYLYPVDYELFTKRKENEVFKRVELNSKEIDWRTREYPLPIENGNCLVPEVVTSIGNYCFNGCSSLTNIQLPSSLISIGGNAFYNTKLKQVEIPEGVTTIGNDCFNECYSLTSVQLPSSLLSIGGNAFYNTNKLIHKKKYVSFSTGLRNNCEKFFRIYVGNESELST